MKHSHAALLAFAGTAAAVALIARLVPPSGEERAIQACEKYIQGQLRSPSTYKRVGGIQIPPQIERYGDGIRTVIVTYDASNAFGTPVRGSAECAFAVGQDGQFPSAISLESAVSLSEAESATRRIQGKEDPNHGLIECCLSQEDMDRALAAVAAGR